MDRTAGPLRVVCASANPHKVAEIEQLLLGAVILEPRPQGIPDVVEDADTFVGNARLKAAAIVASTGMPAIADDTGLCVDALGGAPGVHTARYAGEGCSDADNRAKLLRELADVDDRTATFRTVALIRWPDGSELVAEGTCDGAIASAERGSDGFGYDPVFVPDGAGGRTFAEMPAADKHAISHRGRAFRTLLSVLAQR